MTEVSRNLLMFTLFLVARGIVFEFGRFGSDISRWKENGGDIAGERGIYQYGDVRP
jgi:hypothetical protein